MDVLAVKVADSDPVILPRPRRLHLVANAILIQVDKPTLICAHVSLEPGFAAGWAKLPDELKINILSFDPQLNGDIEKRDKLHSPDCQEEGLKTLLRYHKMSPELGALATEMFHSTHHFCVEAAEHFALLTYAIFSPQRGVNKWIRILSMNALLCMKTVLWLRDLAGGHRGFEALTFGYSRFGKKNSRLYALNVEYMQDIDTLAQIEMKVHFPNATKVVSTSPPVTTTVQEFSRKIDVIEREPQETLFRATMSGTQPLRILITGGARGIGRGLFRHFLGAGHSVYILDSNSSELEHVRRLANTWTASSSRAVWKASLCDLRDRAQIKSIVDDVNSVFDGKLDVLINNAMATEGVGAGKPMEDDSDEIMDDWDTKLAVGLTAPYLLSRLCVPLLKAGSSATGSPGTIVNISSTRAYQAEDNHEAYSTAKAGILGLTQSMSVSLGHRHKVRVNAILPGWIHVVNERAEADEKGIAWEEGLGNEDAEWHPAGRVGKVEDVAKAAEYLIWNGFVTGQEVTVDGGVGRKMIYPE
ncbi:hypothetical protein N0V90_000057 [Kalmusia sp. IMI 367209]|nr:hypothetical protein N0V90_000057 [Kalmusia sp. IMI 367209]